ncbi:hypothetical protein [Prolixibacter denitrificans]|nr:hypothetical protein [Prolixibacter denitrificans]
MKKRLKIYTSILFTIVTLLLIISCSHNKKFDSAKWKQKGLDWQMTDVRENIVDDLINSDTIIGKSKEAVIELLGQPETQSKNKLKYLIREKYSSDIDPDYISNLKVEFDNDGRATKCEIEK